MLSTWNRILRALLGAGVTVTVLVLVQDASLMTSMIEMTTTATAVEDELIG